MLNGSVTCSSHGSYQLGWKWAGWEQMEHRLYQLSVPKSLIPLQCMSHYEAPFASLELLHSVSCDSKKKHGAVLILYCDQHRKLNMQLLKTTRAGWEEAPGILRLGSILGIVYPIHCVWQFLFLAVRLRLVGTDTWRIRKKKNTQTFPTVRGRHVHIKHQHMVQTLRDVQSIIKHTFKWTVACPPHNQLFVCAYLEEFVVAVVACGEWCECKPATPALPHIPSINLLRVLMPCGWRLYYMESLGCRIGCK